MNSADRAYDTLQYENLPFWMAHPDWLHTLGVLSGIASRPVDTCRVLEIGCARGGHLIPLASLLPGAEFVGIDLAPSQIDAAREFASQLQLTNVRFEAMDVRDVPAEWGAFDYIICHGVYSWVPEDARRAILDVCARHLDEHGIAYVSYNTYPGWHARGMLRSMFALEVPPGDPRARIDSARSFMELLGERVPDTLPLKTWLDSELTLLSRLSDRYLYFEHLVDDNVPCYFSDFVKAANDVGLDYVTDAEILSIVPEQLGEAGARIVRERARNADQQAAHVESQQLLDLLTLRHFRRSLLVRRGSPVSYDFDPDRFTSVIVANLAVNDDGDVELDLDDGIEVSIGDDGNFQVTSGDPVAVLAPWHVARAGRHGLPVAELIDLIANQVGSDCADRVLAWVRDGFLEGRLLVGTWKRPFAEELPDRPVGFVVARAQAAQPSSVVTNLRHEEVTLDDLERSLLVAMDGTRDRLGLTAAARRDIDAGLVVVEVNDEPTTDETVLEDLIQQRIDRLVDRALIMSPDH